MQTSQESLQKAFHVAIRQLQELQERFINGTASQVDGELSTALTNQLALITSLSGAMQHVVDSQQHPQVPLFAPPPPPPPPANFQDPHAVNMIMMMHYQMQQNMQQFQNHQRHALYNHQQQQQQQVRQEHQMQQQNEGAATPSGLQKDHDVKKYNDKTLIVPARQRSASNRVPRGAEKKLTFLLPETPVDEKKLGARQEAMGADEVEVAEAMLGGAQAAVTPGSLVGGAGRTASTPGKVASTPMAIEVLTNLFTSAADKQDTPVDPDDDEFDFEAQLEGATKKPKRPRKRPTTAVAKAAAAAAAAVSRPKKSGEQRTCNCKRSQCLKMYCECFAGSGYCLPGCACVGCKNSEENVDMVNIARAGILMKDPTAFDEKVKTNGHQKGCRCKRSKCLKKYCECYNAGVKCNPNICQCIGCHNAGEAEDAPEDPPESVPVDGDVKDEDMFSGKGLHFPTPEHGAGDDTQKDGRHASLPEGVSFDRTLKEGTKESVEEKHKDASAVVSFIEAATPDDVLDIVNSPTPQIEKVEEQPRRITNVTAIPQHVKENIEPIQKRPRRAASGGVSGAVAAARADWGLDHISPPSKRVPQPRRSAQETKALLLEALEIQKSREEDKDDVDVLSALIGLNSTS
ncbi:hypothetical protein M9434_004075 [Picochlorum sp. BPE23]|nr:hypothetical protein M9434_004075 [Picochlorum sp. BPE23]KAI8113659.1 hypothetical protein M9435_003654 [Picochlorum sp. BPE23]